MDTNRRAQMSLGLGKVIAVASLVTFAIAGQGQAEAAQGYPTLRVEPDRCDNTVAIAPPVNRAMGDLADR